MHLKHNVGARIERAVETFSIYAVDHARGAMHLAGQFRPARPIEPQTFIAVEEAASTDVVRVPVRELTRITDQVECTLAGARGTDWAWRNLTGRIRRHRLVLTVVCLALMFPMFLSPSHPVAVYGYLADSHLSSLTPKAFASAETDLCSFLTSPEQVRRYKSDILADMLDTRSGKLFVIVRCPDGTLRQEAIRTWNGFLPAALPASLGNWLDRKELSYLGDEVDTWLRGNTIVAIGHYHAFGGVPSAGDSRAQLLSDVSEVVIVNGLVPMVYLDGNVVSYGANVVVSEEVFRSMRPLELSLVMDVNQRFSWSEEPGQPLTSFLGYLRDYRGVDITNRATVARCMWAMCREFEDNYRAVFTKGFDPNSYKDDADKSSLLRNLGALNYWGHRLSFSPPGVLIYTT